MGARRVFVDGFVGGESRDAFHALVEAWQRENMTAVLAVDASALSSDRRPRPPRNRLPTRSSDCGGRRDPRDRAIDRDRQVPRA